ncbi:DNA repair exonuclease [Cohnella lubricantis]|uniref:DNA repair exonuclease n=1 Tax=Cohnella lubricantis TaxID=2163172 RepID=A0A841TK18_9BACL|nr:DNA repair exonuclease [Cohnella lubricantis]MBB6678831.1 DNA repair exonuclease [Cohnella lubricantis]MBP2118267.1 DNA repair exonuclease SbcCD nuclease subunit [Cohnella lubricantis]
MGIPFKFLHAADLHLDSPFRGLSRVPPAVRERLKESTFASLRQLLLLARREKVDFVVLSGDLYDAADRSLRAQLRMQRMLTELAEEGIQTFIVHGNHDPLDGWKAKLDWPGKVHIFDYGDPEPVPAYRRDGEMAAYVYGISYPRSSVTDNLAARYRVRPGAPFHLAVLHANVDGNANHDNYSPCKLSDLTAAGFDYWALGHIHDRRVLREYPHVVYPGNIQGRSIRETGPKGAYVVSVSETGSIELSFRDTADVLWHERIVTIDGAGREEELKARLLKAVDESRSESGGRPLVLRLRIEGRGELHGRLQREETAAEWLEELREWCGSPEDSDDWVWIDSLVVRTRAPLAEAAEGDEDGFLGVLTRLGREAAASGDGARELLEAAMDASMRQPKLREWCASRSDEEREELISRATELAASLLGEAGG